VTFELGGSTAVGVVSDERGAFTGALDRLEYD